MNQSLKRNTTHDNTTTKHKRRTTYTWRCRLQLSSCNCYSPFHLTFFNNNIPNHLCNKFHVIKPRIHIVTRTSPLCSSKMNISSEERWKEQLYRHLVHRTCRRVRYGDVKIFSFIKIAKCHGGITEESNSTSTVPSTSSDTVPCAGLLCGEVPPWKGLGMAHTCVSPARAYTSTTSSCLVISTALCKRVCGLLHGCAAWTDTGARKSWGYSCVGFPVGFLLQNAFATFFPSFSDGGDADHWTVVVVRQSLQNYSVWKQSYFAFLLQNFARVANVVTQACILSSSVGSNSSMYFRFFVKTIITTITKWALNSVTFGLILNRYCSLFFKNFDMLMDLWISSRCFFTK